jgi:pyruvate ferredoxin oxidoreductase alpha subunit
VLDQNLSMGSGGVLHAELAATLAGRPGAPRACASFVGGLGGRDVALAEFRAMAEETARAARTGVPPPPRLLYTAGELREVRKLQAIARGEREALGAGVRR